MLVGKIFLDRCCPAAFCLDDILKPGIGTPNLTLILTARDSGIFDLTHFSRISLTACFLSSYPLCAGRRPRRRDTIASRDQFHTNESMPTFSVVLEGPIDNANQVLAFAINYGERL